MLRKPKNPTFNEFFPSLIIDNEIFLFDCIFSEVLVNKIYKAFDIVMDEEQQLITKYSFDSNLRLKYGCREIDDTVVCSGIVKDLQPLTNGTQQSEFLTMMFAKFWYKWGKLLDNVYAQTYNPIENYDRQEDTSLSYEGSENVTRNVDSDRKTKGTTADTRNDTSSANSSSQKNVFAFDSAEASPSDSDSGTTTATGTGTSNSTVDNSDVEKRTETEGHSFTNRKNVTASRIHGNVGVTTNQQMMTSELEFRLKNDFFNTVYEDIANTVLKPIY